MSRRWKTSVFRHCRPQRISQLTYVVEARDTITAARMHSADGIQTRNEIQNEIRRNFPFVLKFADNSGLD